MLNILILLLATFLTAALSLVGGIIFLSNSKLARHIQKIGPAIAAAILLYTVFGDIVPEVLEETIPGTPFVATPLDMTITILVGFLGCALVGSLMGHFHHHVSPHIHTKNHAKKQHGIKNKNEAITMLAVDSVHNAVDGIMLGIAFSTSPAIGISACLATIAHEIPQEVGDFAIMNKAKIPKNRIIKWQFLSGLILVPAALIAYFVGDIFEVYLPALLALIAGFLLYIAFSQIVYIIGLLRAKLPRQLRIRK